VDVMVLEGCSRPRFQSGQQKKGRVLEAVKKRKNTRFMKIGDETGCQGHRYNLRSVINATGGWGRWRSHGGACP